jgi:hypothetical protein
MKVHRRDWEEVTVWSVELEEAVLLVMAEAVAEAQRVASRGTCEEVQEALRPAVVFLGSALGSIVASEVASVMEAESGASA